MRNMNSLLNPQFNRRTLIDTGESGKPEYIEALKSLLESEKAEISRIFITHCHPDHIGGLEEVCNELNLRGVEIFKLRLDSVDPSLLSNYYNYRGDAENFSFVCDGFTLTIEDGITLRVIASPGHTADHACVLIEELKVLFSGDCILGGASAVFDDLSAYMESLKRLLFYPLEFIYPGHGPVIKNPTAYIKNYIQHREARSNEILRVLESEERIKPVDIR